METQESPVIFNPTTQKEILRAQKRAARAALKEERRFWYNAEKEKRDAEDREYDARLQDPSYWVNKQKQIADDLKWDLKDEEKKRIKEIQEIWNDRVLDHHDDEEEWMLYEQGRTREDRKEELKEEHRYWEDLPPSEREIERAEEAQVELQRLNSESRPENFENFEQRKYEFNFPGNSEKFKFQDEAIIIIKRLSDRRDSDAKKRKIEQEEEEWRQQEEDGQHGGSW
ncbi:hypothetical protein RUND412_008495 [Rhizina undulata]